MNSFYSGSDEYSFTPWCYMTAVKTELLQISWGSRGQASILARQPGCEEFS